MDNNGQVKKEDAILIMARYPNSVVGLNDKEIENNLFLVSEKTILSITLKSQNLAHTIVEMIKTYDIQLDADINVVNSHSSHSSGNLKNNYGKFLISLIDHCRFAGGSNNSVNYFELIKKHLLIYQSMEDIFANKMV